MSDEATRKQAAFETLNSLAEEGRRLSSEVKTGGDKLKDLLGFYTKFAFDNEQEFIEKFCVECCPSDEMPGGYHLTTGEFYVGERKIMFEINDMFGGFMIEIDTQEYIDWVDAR